MRELKTEVLPIEVPRDVDGFLDIDAIKIARDLGCVTLGYAFQIEGPDGLYVQLHHLDTEKGLDEPALGPISEKVMGLYGTSGEITQLEHPLGALQRGLGEQLGQGEHEDNGAMLPPDLEVELFPGASYVLPYGSERSILAQNIGVQAPTVVEILQSRSIGSSEALPGRFETAGSIRDYIAAGRPIRPGLEQWIEDLVDTSSTPGVISTPAAVRKSDPDLWKDVILQ